MEALTRRAADVYERIVGRSGSERGEAFAHAFHGLLGALGNLALLAWNRGELEAAEAGYRDVLKRFAERYGSDSPYIHPSLPGLARLLARRGETAEAEALLRAALAHAGTPAAGNEWAVADCEEALGELCAGQGRGVEAEAIYRSAVARRERLAEDGWLASAGAAAGALRGLTRLCRDAGRAGEAGELERRAEEWARRRAEALPGEECRAIARDCLRFPDVHSFAARREPRSPLPHFWSHAPGAFAGRVRQCPAPPARSASWPPPRDRWPTTSPNSVTRESNSSAPTTSWTSS